MLLRWKLTKAVALAGVIAVFIAAASALAASPNNVADRVFGQGGSFVTTTCNSGGVSAASLCLPHGGAFDGQGNLWVADFNNNRVLEFDDPTGSCATCDSVADRVIGQPDFVSTTCNNGGISASSLCSPLAVAADAGGNLYVADSVNRRVLEYDSPLTTDLVADRAFGQPSFSSSGCNVGGVSAASICLPGGIAIDAAIHMYLADSDNNRVLEYDSPLTSDLVADRVIGQPNFTSTACNNGGLSAGSLCDAAIVALDAAGNLYVADDGNNRVLEYNSPLTSDLVADRVFGQPNFTSSACNNGGVSASSLCRLAGLAVDAHGNVYVGEQGNSRVLEYDHPLTTDTVADRVWGQGGDFTTNTCNKGGVSAGSLCGGGVVVDGKQNLYVSDTDNNRVLEYNIGRDHKTDANGDGYSAADEDTLANCGVTSCASIITLGAHETPTCKDPGKSCGTPGAPLDESVPARIAPPPADGYGCSVTLDIVPPLMTKKLAQSDVDLDGSVTILDLSKVASWFGNTINVSVTDPRWEGDMDGDGHITILDLSAMASNFGRSVAGDCGIH